jgi:hypothetical protein
VWVGVLGGLTGRIRLHLPRNLDPETRCGRCIHLGIGIYTDDACDVVGANGKPTACGWGHLCHSFELIAEIVSLRSYSTCDGGPAGGAGSGTCRSTHSIVQVCNEMPKNVEECAIVRTYGKHCRLPSNSNAVMYDRRRMSQQNCCLLPTALIRTSRRRALLLLPKRLKPLTITLAQ